MYDSKPVFLRFTAEQRRYLELKAEDEAVSVPGLVRMIVRSWMKNEKDKRILAKCATRKK